MSCFHFRMIKTAAVYIHIPFCRKKCGYCDFFSCAGFPESLAEQTVSAVCSEIRSFASENTDFNTATIFIGGGTPNFLRPDLLEKILNTAVSYLNPLENTEFTIEANPEFTDPDFLDMIGKYGINRLSLGIQSFSRRYLEILDREADAETVRNVLDHIRENWDGVLSLDLISGLPGQTAEEFISDIHIAQIYRPHHLSVYNLTAEMGTNLYEKVKSGILKMPDDNQAAAITEACNTMLESSGYVQYEVSNYCRDNYVCRHNLAYWHLEPYVGFGPSAVSTLPSDHGPVRISNPKDFDSYFVGKKDIELLDYEDFLKDHLIMNFRLKDGMNIGKFRKRFYVSPHDLFPETIDSWIRKRLLFSENGNLFLNRKGIMVLNRFLYDIFNELDTDRSGILKSGKIPVFS